MESNIQQTKASAFPLVEEKRCPHCHRSYKEFVHIGKFGCADCYKTFGEQLDPILKRVHSGNTEHIGKIPKRIGGTIYLRKQISDLKDMLKLHIENEEFEKAAEVRDKVRSLEKRFEAQEGGDEL